MSDWRRYSACSPETANDFFEDRDTIPGAPRDRKRIQRAKKQCIACIVRTECLIDAIATDDEYGIRGGYTRSERDQLLEQAA